METVRLTCSGNQLFQVLMLCMQKSLLGLVLPDEICLIFSSEP